MLHGPKTWRKKEVFVASQTARCKAKAKAQSVRKTQQKKRKRLVAAIERDIGPALMGSSGEEEDSASSGISSGSSPHAGLSKRATAHAKAAKIHATEATRLATLARALKEVDALDETPSTAVSPSPSTANAKFGHSGATTKEDHLEVPAMGAQKTVEEWQQMEEEGWSFPTATSSSSSKDTAVVAGITVQAVPEASLAASPFDAGKTAKEEEFGAAWSTPVVENQQEAMVHYGRQMFKWGQLEAHLQAEQEKKKVQSTNFVEKFHRGLIQERKERAEARTGEERSQKRM